MIPNVSGTLRAWERSVLIKTITTTSVDFVETEVVTGRTQLCVVQVADKAQLNPETIDWNLEYLMVHSRSNIDLDELIEFQGKDYLVKSKGPWAGYGYTEVIAEETNRPLKEVTG